MPKRAAHRRGHAMSPSLGSETECVESLFPIVLIGIDTVDAHTSDDLCELAKERLMTQLTTGEIKPIGETMAYGNKLGLDTLLEFEETKANNRHLNDVTSSLQADIKGLKETIKDLQEVIKTIPQELNFVNLRVDESMKHRITGAQVDAPYLDIRHRFLDVYRRDHGQEMLSTSASNIHRGNIRAHGGDCVVDAYLFTSGQRTDRELMEAIYGLSAENVSLLHKNENLEPFEAINKFGGWRADVNKRIPDNILSVYRDYIALQVAQPTIGPRADPQSRLGGLFWKFQSMAKQHEWS